MDRRSPVEGWRAAALAVALFAITLNFLQPLAHAALMRSGGPTTWAAICQPGTTQDDVRASPAPAQIHDCCIGLAHAPLLAAPPTHSSWSSVWRRSSCCLRPTRRSRRSAFATGPPNPADLLSPSDA